MTKYVTKADTSLSRGAKSILRGIIQIDNNTEAAESIRSTLMRAMSKMLGQRTIGRQETCHLINQKGIVKCSHRFVKIDLRNRSTQLNLHQNIERRQQPAVQQTQREMEQSSERAEAQQHEIIQGISGETREEESE